MKNKEITRKKKEKQNNMCRASDVQFDHEEKRVLKNSVMVRPSKYGNKENNDYFFYTVESAVIRKHLWEEINIKGKGFLLRIEIDYE